MTVFKLVKLVGRMHAGKYIMIIRTSAVVLNDDDDYVNDQDIYQ